MKKYYSSEHNDCIKCCIATFLQMDIKLVPNFSLYSNDYTEITYFLWQWLQDLGFMIIKILKKDLKDYPILSNELICLGGVKNKEKYDNNAHCVLLHLSCDYINFKFIDTIIFDPIKESKFTNEDIEHFIIILPINQNYTYYCKNLYDQLKEVKNGEN